MADQPIDYSLRQTPQQAFMGGLQTGDALNQLDQQQLALRQQQAAQQQALQAQALMQRVLSNPGATASDYGAVVAANPKFGTQIKEAWDRKTGEQQQNSLSSAAKVHSALQSGRTDLAQQLVDEQIRAMENSGAAPQELAQAKTMRDMIAQAPDYARLQIGSVIAAIPGGDKYFSSLASSGKEARDQAEAPADLLTKRATAQIKAAEAGVAPEKVRTDIDNTKSQIAERSARLGLDVDKFNLDFDQALTKLQQGQGVPALSPGMEKVQAESVGLSLTAKTLSDQAAALSAALTDAKTSVGGKPLRWLAENTKTITGSEDSYSSLRRDYARIRNQGLLSDLPPGPASDKDIGLMKEGFPNENASPEHIAAWLKSFSNVQKAIAQKEEAKAEWISNVGALRNTPKDIEVMGIRVPSGMSFTEFVRKGIKLEPAASPGTPAAPGAPGRPRYLDYGK